MNPYGDIFKELEKGLWEHDVRVDEGRAKPYPYTDEEFRACLKIFMEGLLWKTWEEQERKGMEFSDRLLSAESVGNELSDLILKHTGINSRELYDGRM